MDKLLNIPVVSYYKSLVKKSEEYFDYHNHKTSTSRSWYENGYLESVINYHKGRKEGLSQEYYPNGVLHRVSNYSDGLWDGQVTEYHPNGQMKSIRTYNLGKQEGYSILYYPNGHLCSIKHYQDGVMNGKTLHYSSTEDYPSILSGEEYFKDGVPLKTIRYTTTKTEYNLFKRVSVYWIRGVKQGSTITHLKGSHPDKSVRTGEVTYLSSKGTILKSLEIERIKPSQNLSPIYLSDLIGTSLDDSEVEVA